MRDRIRVAAAGVESRPGDTAGNLEKIEAQCAAAAREKVDLILFPELSVTGFIPNHPTGDHNRWLRAALAGAREVAEPVAGKAVRALCGIAGRHNLLAAAGLLEDAGNLLYNTLVLAGGGGVEGVWRKLHVPMFEMPFYNGGPAPEVAETALGRIGGNICFDVLLPESARLLAVQNVEIVLMPFAADPPPGTAQAWSEWAGPAVRARAAENGVFAIASNYTGRVEFAGVEQTFPGGALIAGPRGEALGADHCDSLLVADLEARTLREARGEPEYLFRFRRPELYGPLAR